MRGIAALLLSCFALSACGPMPSVGSTDATGEGGSRDAALDETNDGGLDAMTDAVVDAVDASPPTCTVAGVQGECIDVAQCTAGRHATPGHCPGPTSIQCCTPDTDGGVEAGWCPAVMSTPNEGLVEEPGDPGCPDGMIHIATFCIDRFEASLEVVNADGTTQSWSPYYNPGSMNVRAVSLRGAIPQGYISGVQAGAACAAAGKRLCTNTEWLRACQGPSGTTYPYGNTREPGVCNDARAEHPAIECFQTSDSWIWSELQYPGINQQPMTVTHTGERSGCITAEGAFDMMGNMHEWTSDPAGTFRGGYYVDTVMNGPGCLYATTAHPMTHWDYSTGFRCCADPR